MIFRDREKLAIIELKEDEENISFDRIKVVILERPSNVIYCEKNGKLYGIISMGDVGRAKDNNKEYIVINTHFISLRVGDGKYIRAREIFNRKTDINALPILEDGRLKGAWSRWNVTVNAYVPQKKQCCNGDKLGFICPSSIFKDQFRIFMSCCNKLISYGADVRQIKREEVLEYADSVEWILTIDEDECRAFVALYDYILNRKDIGKKIKTYNWYMEFCGGCYWSKGNRWWNRQKYISSVLDDIKKQGIEVFGMRFKYDELYNETIEKLRNKFYDIGKKTEYKLYPSMFNDFFGNVYSREDADEVAHLLSIMTLEPGTGRLKDHTSRFYNVLNGERYTVGQPSNYRNSVYFVGPCLVYGAYVEDKNTIESFLQQKINAFGFEIKVLNYGSPSHRDISMQLACVLDMPLKEGDIVVLFLWDDSIKNNIEINMTDVLNQSDINFGWMIDSPEHCNAEMNNRYADVIFDKIRSFLLKSAPRQGEHITFECDAVKKVYLDRYFSEFEAFQYNRIGAIVMNCNPFTYGHRYLIEQAYSIVDFLIIFVVEEDKSAFSFDERFVMVCEGVSDLENVMVVPSGPFILSQTTFPEYFIKTCDEDLVENVEADITFFAERIAPLLNIRYRFVGEEPEDEVTNEYNLAMKRILPANGIKLIEIPRKRLGEKCISASTVRECLEYDNVSELKNLVPESTMRVLFGVTVK